MDENKLQKLLYLSKKHNEDALSEIKDIFEGYIKNRIRSCYGNHIDEYSLNVITNSTMNDVFKAIERYRDELNPSIRSYLAGIINCKIKTYANKELKEINYYELKKGDIKIISLNQLIDEDHDEAFEMIVADPSVEYRPKEHLDDKIALERIHSIIKECTSPLEQEVIELTAQKYSNREVADIMRVDIKTVSNAKERARVKMRRRGM